MPIIRISDEAAHEINQLIKDGLVKHIPGFFYSYRPPTTRITSTLIIDQINTIRKNASLSTSEL